MKKSYVIAPVVLAALFALYHHGAVQEAREREETRAWCVAEEKRIIDERRAAVQRETFEQARLQAATREQQEREREEKKRRDYAALMAKLAAEAEAFLEEARQIDAETKQVRGERATLREKHHQLERTAAATAREVEIRRAERRHAEMEVQHAAATMLGHLNEILAADQGRF